MVFTINITILMTAFWFAVLTGLAEVVLLLSAKILLHRYIYYLGPYMIWMTPLANLLVFSIPAVLLLFVAHYWPKGVTLRLIIGVFAFLSFLSLLLIITSLHKVAALILAFGLAIQLAHLAGSHPDILYKPLWRSIGWTRFSKQPHKSVKELESQESSVITRRDFLLTAGTTMAGLALGVFGWERLVDKLALSRLPDKPPTFPNVLLVILDTVRAVNLSLYGYHRKTSPQLERLARNGVVFERAISTAPWTLPSHASLFTGRFPHELNVDYNKGLDGIYPTLSEALSAGGYETAGFVSNIWYCSRQSGLNRGFTRYQDFMISPGLLLNSSTLIRTLSTNEQLRRNIGYYEELGRRYAPEINNEVLKWFSSRDQNRPFFASINYFDAHEPYLPPAPFDTLFGEKIIRMNPRHNVEWKWTSEEIQAEVDAYDGSIAYLDQHVGQLLDRLSEDGLLDNTLVIIASDHGEEFLEHGMTDHGYSLYWPSLHVPLMISYPARVPKGIFVSEPVSLRDLPTTILDLIGFSNSIDLPGKSLARYWETAPSVGDNPSNILLSEIKYTPGYPSWYPCSKGDMQSLVFGRYHYIKNGDGSEEIYDIELDPFEKENIIGASHITSEYEYFRTTLNKILYE